MREKINIVICTIKSYHIAKAVSFAEKTKEKYNVNIISDNAELSVEVLDEFNSDYIFFPHWSHIIPPEIYNKYVCIVFHTAPLPDYRGGSPIQHQILDRNYKSKVCALKVCDKIDGGDIYSSYPIDLQTGNIDQIIKMISDIVFDKMIEEIVDKSLKPVKQPPGGFFRPRRTPEMSNMIVSSCKDIEDAYNFIRMMDGEGYPSAYIDINEFIRISLHDVKYDENGKLKGEFTVHEK